LQLLFQDNFRTVESFSIILMFSLMCSELILEIVIVEI